MSNLSFAHAPATIRRPVEALKSHIEAQPVVYEFCDKYFDRCDQRRSDEWKALCFDVAARAAALWVLWKFLLAVWLCFHVEDNFILVPMLIASALARPSL